MPTTHCCRHPVVGSSIYIEGNNREICDKAACIVCRTLWYEPEEFANQCFNLKKNLCSDNIKINDR